MQSEHLARFALEQLDNMKAQKVVRLDVQGISSITDFMIVATGTSSRHVISIAQKLEQSARQHGLPVLGIEGEKQGDWVLLDLGDVLVHVMQAEPREFYALEKLWQHEFSFQAVQ